MQKFDDVLGVCALFKINKIENQIVKPKFPEMSTPIPLSLEFGELVKAEDRRKGC